MKICSYICSRLFNSYILMYDFKKMDEAAYLLKAMSNGTRLCVIALLSEQEELTVSQIGEQLQCEQSLLSHHLTDMRAKRLLNCRREGKNCYYSLKNKEIVNILNCIESCQCEE
jgi:DNA-binding transcriptional ArsR family regulator